MPEIHGSLWPSHSVSLCPDLSTIYMNSTIVSDTILLVVRFVQMLIYGRECVFEVEELV